LGKTLEETLDHKLGLQDRKTVDLSKMERQLDHIIHSTPDAVSRELASNIVGRGGISEGNAVPNASMATWTLLKHGKTILAISCGHCAFAYDFIDQHGLRFVEIPKELCSLVKEVGYMPNYIDGEKRERKYDVALLKLGNLPTGTDFDALPEWLALNLHDGSRGRTTKVGGMTVSGGSAK
jgi:hypothetical protein